MKLPRLRIDPYIYAILIAVGLAVLLPVRGAASPVFSLATKFAVALLFFLYGARLAREAVVAGLAHWRLHLLTLSITFIVFPLIGFLWGFVPGAILAPSLVAGMTYLCTLPSTIQSSVALVAGAKGNVPAAVCSASASNMLGVAATPLLVGLLMHAQGVTVSADAFEGVFIQLLLPFVAGQIVHPWLAPIMAPYRDKLVYYDRLTIMMIVYGAFSSAIVGGVWRQVTLGQFILLICLCALLLAFILVLGVRAARLFGFAREDEVVVAFCGSQKGMAAGVPMAALLFPAPQVGLILLPVLVYHQLQLMTCAVLAGRYAERAQMARTPA